MELQTAFYIVGIVFMGFSLLLMVALLVMVLVIRSKVNEIYRSVQQKLDMAQDIFSKVSPVYGVVRTILKLRRIIKPRK